MCLIGKLLSPINHIQRQFIANRYSLRDFRDQIEVTNHSSLLISGK